MSTKISSLLILSFIFFLSGCGDLDSSTPDERKIRLGPCPEVPEGEKSRSNSPSSDERASMERDRRDRYLSEEWGAGLTLDRENEEEVVETPPETESENANHYASDHASNYSDDEGDGSSNEILKAHWRIYEENHFQFFFKISGNWIEYHDQFGDDLYHLPEGREIKLTDQVSGKIQCHDRDCLRLNVSLEKNEKSASIQIVRLPMRPLGKQLLKGCEIPIFFKYERDQFLERSHELQKNFATLQSVDALDFYVTQIQSWNHEKASSIALELSSQSHPLISLGTPNATEHGKLFIEEDHGLSFEGVHYRLTQAGDLPLLDHLKFKFNASTADEVCYQILFIPETIRDGS